MKPIKLTIAGLHSFRKKQEIDFTLVSDTGLFGIFGPTGSGKSTILDAITLALYGKVERSDRNRTGILNQLEDKIHVSFTFELTLGREKEKYTVERVYKGNKENRVRSELARVIKHENDKEIVLADKETEVTKEIIEITGLTDDDFTRAVVLPQGKFAEFLTLKAQDRRPMLERLFNLDLYGRRLKEKAQSRENELKRNRDEIQAKQQMLEHANKEKLDELTSQLKEAMKEMEEAKKENESFQHEYKQMEFLWETQRKLSETREQLKLLLKRKEEIAQLEVTKKKAEKALAISPTLKRHQRLDHDYQELHIEIEKLTGEVEALNKIVKEKEHIFQQNRTEAELTLPKLQERNLQLESALQYEKDLIQLEAKHTAYNVDLQELLPKKKQIEKKMEETAMQMEQSSIELYNQKEQIENLSISTKEREKVDKAFQIVQDFRHNIVQLEEKRKEIKETERKIASLTAQMETEKEKYSAEEQKVQEIENQLEQLQGKQISEDAWYKQDKILAEIAMKLGKLQDLDKDILDANREIEELIKNKAGIEKEIEDKSAKHQHLETEIAKNKESLAELQQESRDNLIAKLAVELVDGKPCAVCGSTHHPAPVKEKYKDDVTEQRAELEGIIASNEILFTESRIAIQRLVDREHHTQEQLEKQNGLKATKEEEFQVILDELPEYYQRKEIDLIHDLYQEEKDRHERLKEQMKDGKQQLDLAKENHSITKEFLQQIKNHQLLLEQEIMLTIHSKDKISKELTTLETKGKEAEQRLYEIDVTFTMDKVEAKKREIQEADKGREILGKSLKEYEDILNKLSEQEKNQKNFFIVAEKEQAELEQSMKYNLDEIEKVRAKLTEITNGKPVKLLIEEVDQQREKINIEVKHSEEEWKNKSKLYTQLEKELSSKQAVESNTKDQLIDTKQELEQLMVQYQVDDFAFIEKHLLPNEEMKKIEENIKEYNDKKFLYMEREKQYVEELEGKEITEEDWEFYLSKKNQVKEREEELKEKVTELTFQHKKLEEDYQSFKKLEKERKSIQHDLDIASELNQVLRGNAFVDFIAIEYLKNITAIASDKLMKLTRNRYSLRVEQDGTFYMIDELNGGLSRPVNTLSGGETFITSLSLALALSSQIQLKGGRILEFFFLDEGFGSLDSDLLDTVMMTLEKLLSGHMIIGIISHVPELQNRMNRKFMVTPADEKGNGSVVKVEYL